MSMTSKPGRVLAPGQARGEPAYGSGGVRPKGGVSRNRALVRNVGTWLPDAKGDAQAGDPCKRLSTDAGARDGAARSSVETRESGLSEGAASFSFIDGSTSDGRSL